MIADEELPLSEVASRLRISRRMVFHRIRSGQLRGRKVGWMWLVPASEVEAAKDTEWYRSSKLQPPSARPS